MEITWLGHACFRLKGSSLTLVTDPYDASLGYDPGALRAEVVTLSHPQSPHHAHVERVQGARRVLRGPGEYEIAGVFILGVKTFRDSRRGAERGANTVYRLAIDNVAICHLGEIGHVPTADHVSAIGDVDVLLVPVGGGNTLSAAQASETVSLLEPKLIIPMHYQTEDTSEPLEPVEPFLKELGIADIARVPKLSVTSSSLPASPRVVVLDHKAG